MDTGTATMRRDSVPGVCPVLLVVELELDLVSDLVDEDLSQQDAHQLWERKRRKRRGG